jgi:hypothetical protein
MAPRAAPEVVDHLTTMTMEELEAEEEKLKEKHKEFKVKRNFVQQERVK